MKKFKTVLLILVCILPRFINVNITVNNRIGIDNGKDDKKRKAKS